MPRLAKVVNVLAIRQVKQGTETTGFRIGFTLHSCQYVCIQDTLSSRAALGLPAFRPSASREQRYLAYNQYVSS